MIDVVYYLFNSPGIGNQSGKLMLPKWVKVSEERFNDTLSTVTEAKNNGFKTNTSGREITLDKTESLLKDLGHEILNRREYCNNIVDDAESILKAPRLTRNQNKMLELLSLLKEIVDGSLYEESDDIAGQESDKQPDTTDMPDLESEECAEQRKNQSGQGLKILTPDQMLSRLPISLAQLKAGNDSEKLKNEIRQVLYSLYRPKNVTKQLYKNFIDLI